MNWKIILQLSILGAIMAVGTVSLIPMSIEPFFWLIIFLFSAWVIAKTCREKYFLHGFLLSMINCVWITAAHVIFYNSYMHNHPQMATMPLFLANHPRESMMITGLFVGAVCGLIEGLLSYIASKITSRKAATA